MRELSHHVLDLLENALQADSTEIDLEIIEDPDRDLLWIRVEDNGRGMDPDTQAKALDPFYTTRTTRHVGLGLPMLKAAAERCEGSLSLSSKLGVGTRVEAWFVHSHIDRAPLGDMPSTILGALMSANDRWELRYVHRAGEQELVLDTRQVREALGDVPFGHPMVREWLESFLRQGYAALYEETVAADSQTESNCRNKETIDATDQVAG